MERKWLVLFAVSLVVLLLIPLDSLAGVFGPKKYERTSGAPDVFTERLSVCNTSATYKMIVENGEGGLHRVSSASIVVNGAEVVSENEFRQKMDRIERSMTLSQESVISVKVASGLGDFLKVSIDCLSGCLGININSPVHDVEIDGSDAIVTGSLVNTQGEIGVAMKSSGTNGEVIGLGQVSGNGFAGLVPLQPGANTITVIAADECGYRVQDSITINTASMEEPVRISVNPSSGVVAPSGKLSVAFEARTNISGTVINWSWDMNGDNTPDQEGENLSKTIAEYTATGLYFPAVTIIGSDGNKYTAKTMLNVLSMEALDALLKVKWDKMSAALANGDVDKATAYFDDSTRETYRAQFMALTPALETVGADMRDISFVRAGDGSAEYEIISTRNNVKYSFFLLFVMDGNGLWKIRVF